MSNHIPLKKYHICTERCANQYVKRKIDDECFTLELASNPHYQNGKCQNYNKIENAYIQVENKHDMDNVIELDKLVITDTEIKIPFSYPLRNEHIFTFKSTNGFTKKDIIINICETYAYIYKMEEETATKHKYYFTTKCDNCANSYVGASNTIINEDKLSCSICLNDFVSKEMVVKLPCKHIYHDTCINTWLNKVPSCPLCRQNMEHYGCTQCKKGLITTEYVGITAPIEFKTSGLLNRDQTDGVWGIWGHDIGDLVIEELTYDFEAKTVKMCIGS